MRTLLRHALFLSPALLGGACATLLSSSSSSAPFQGAEAVEARIKEIHGKIPVANECLKDPAAKDVRGIFEVTADAAGKLVGRAMLYQGKPEIERCVVDAINKSTVAPLPGPQVSTFWDFSAATAPKPTAPDSDFLKTAQMTFSSRIRPEIDGCAQRNLPPDFPADIAIGYSVFPGGKIAGATVIESNAKDGSFDSCVQNAIGGATFQDLKFDGGFPLRVSFHVGLSNKM